MAAVLAGAIFCAPGARADGPPTPQGAVRLPGHVPQRELAGASLVGRAPLNERVQLALALPLRNQTELSALLYRLYDPTDPLYGHFLTPQQFADRFGPTPAQYAAVSAWAASKGMTVTRTHANRLLVDVEAPTRVVESAFSVQLSQYVTPDGRIFRAPSAGPAIPAALASSLSGVIGLDTAAVWRPHNRMLAGNLSALAPASLLPRAIGTGPGGGLTPSDIKAAYNLTSTGRTGQGQTLAVFELSGYTASDITGYESHYGLPSVPLQNVLVDGASGGAGSGADEVTLDIELQIALAPNAAKVMVYEGPNSSAGVVDTYNRIATDNQARQISTSWGIYESGSGSATLNSENSIFQQMAAQGQSIFAASGDSGAYDNGSTLSVDDPASQPYVVGCGGTTLSTNGAGGTWKSEKTWNGGSVNAGAGGGGISSVWSIPTYQQGLISAASKGSATMRNVPDVSLNADPNTGYSIYYRGAWYIYGGTSCTAPLWAGFTALVNEQRAANAKAAIGFLNPPLYAAATGANYGLDFHDIADGSTNLYYPAVTGLDDATGWGSLNGQSLLNELAGSSGGGTPPPPPPPPTTSQLLGNPGFENGLNAAPWVATSGVIDNSTSEPAHSGSWKAWLCGYGRTHTDTLYQQVSIPATATSATLSFWLHIDTAERASAGPNDILKVQVRDSSGAVLATLATYSNRNHNTGYVQEQFDVSQYIGHTVQVYLVGTENSTRQTSFVVDDFALDVQ